MLPMFRRVVLSALIVALVVPNVPLFAAHAVAGQEATGTISGTARNAAGAVMPNIGVRLRNVGTGQLVATTRADAQGQFRFAGLPPGNYAVELVNDRSEVLGFSAPVLLTAQTMVATDLAVTASAIGQAAAAGGGAFLTSTLGLVTIAAIGAGVVGVVVAANRSDASPSR